MLKGLRELGLDLPDTQANFVWLPAGPLTHTWADSVRRRRRDGPPVRR